jgi:ABC-type antimicrobial peptide transport system permease subunit
VTGRTVGEGWRIAVEQLRANKLRSALTIVGVVIGVATVMAMASIVQGIREQIVNTLEVVGPTTFRILRFFSEAPLNPDALPREVRIRPVLQPEEAGAIGRLPEIHYSAIWTSVFLGRIVRVGGRPLRVVGVWESPANIFEPPGQEIAAILPYETVRRFYDVDETNALIILVKPRTGVSVSRAMDAATLQLRRMRGLRAGEPDSFDMITSDQVLKIFDNLTSAFFLVMLLLSSVGLLVGGIGVMAIMMVSVTSRTREIGIRMAVGARRRDILWQFLVEAATLTLIGGLIGITLGLTAGEGIKALFGFETSVPLWSAVVATGVSVSVGLVFGILPARRAAFLDPVEALRHE